MKKLFKILGISIAIILILLLVLPYAFKGKLTEIAKTEINKNVNAQVDFDGISLSLFRSFPHFNMGIKNISITGKDEFEGVSLAKLDKLSVTIDLFSVFSGNNYEIRKINVIRPDLNLLVLDDGLANYDIAVESESTEESQEGPGTESPVVIKINNFIISDGNLDYADKTQNINVHLSGLNHSLNGDLSSDFTNLQTNTDIKSLTFNYAGINYFYNTHLNYKAGIEADLKNEIYTLKKNLLKINELQLSFDGSFSMVNEDINIVLAYKTLKTDFKNILSLIPAVYAKDFASISTSGKIGVDGHVKGVYNENNIPSFDVNIGIENGQFKYPDLPADVNDIQVAAKISGKGGDIDNTLIDIPKFHFNMAGNPVDIKLKVANPVSDPLIDGHFEGMIDLATINSFYPLEQGEELAGKIKGNIQLKGRVSDIEKENYNNFTAIGSLLVQDVSYVSGYFRETVELKNMQLNFSPEYVDMVGMDVKIGQNDLQAKGKLVNYIPYVLSDGIVHGALDIQSNYLNIDELMADSDEPEGTETTDTSSYKMSVIEIPVDIDFKMTSLLKKVIYDDIELENVNGEIKVKNGDAILNNLSMDLLNGSMVMNGLYSSKDITKPFVDFGLDIKEIDIEKSYNSLKIIQDYLPIASKMTGTFSVNTGLNSILGQDMMPLYETLKGDGKLLSTSFTVGNINSMNAAADFLKFDKIRQMAIDKILVEFKFVDGKLLIDPFDFNVGNINGSLGGWTAIDQSIDYVMGMEIPRSEFGSATNNVVNGLVNKVQGQGINFELGDMVPVDIKIGGFLNNPSVKVDLGQTGQNLTKQIEKTIKEEVEKKKEEIKKEVSQKAQQILDDADRQANKLISEAKKQAENIRKNAKIAADKVVEEADKNAAKIEAEGKKKGLVAEIAAKESAKKIRSEAKKQSDNLINEADKQANDVINKAKQEADNIRNKAQTEADKLK